MWWVGGHQTVCVLLSCALCALTLCQVTYGCFVTGDVARSTHTVPLSGVCARDNPSSKASVEPIVRSHAQCRPSLCAYVRGSPRRTSHTTRP